MKKERRKCEKKWLKSSNEEDHGAFKNCRAVYNKKLNEQRTRVIREKILGCGNNQGKLYTLVNKLLGRKKTSNPLPTNISEQDLADGFADFFLDKIVQIRTKLNEYPNFDTTVYHCDSELLSFKLLDQDDV